MNKNSLLIFIASVAATGGLLFGFDTGVINVALPAIREQFALTPSQESNVVSAVLFGAMFGPFLSGFLTDILGRKKINIIASIVFVLGSIVAAIATSPGMLIFGRLLLGLAIGIVAATVPLYLAELSPKEKRGQMVTYFQLAITLGILLSYLVGYIFEGAENSWRLMFWAGFIPAILLLVGMFFIPESPRWLLSKGRESEAIEVLKKLRSSDDAQKELQETRDIIEEEKKNKGGWKEFFSKRLRIPLFIGVGIFAIQQFSGINAIIYYSTDIFKGMFSSSQATLATVGVGGIYTYIIFFAISLGPLGWLLISEIYPLKIRGFASSMGSFNHWIFDAMVAYSFPLMRVSSLGSNGGIFFIYMVVVLLGLFFAKFVVFETKGLSLEDIGKVYLIS
ncbi:MAG: sugar porter family MFS transporter [Cytophagaceae bacterium]|nr:sugar porter family MFS transporter [Cytophagaceae bacterium]